MTATEMDVSLVERIRRDMAYEFERAAPPPGFPAFHDISTERHTSAEFHDLEQEHLWPKTWVIAGRLEHIPEPGDFFTFDDLGVPLVVVRGSDLVVFAAGAGPDSGPDRKQSLDRDGAIKSVESAVRVGAGRFVIVSSMGADDPPDDDETFSVYLRAKAAADEAVRAAHIDAIVVRPGRLTDDEATNIVEIAAKVERGQIPRADVAAVLAELIEVADGVNTTIEVVSGTLPIRNAVAQLL